MNPQSSYIRKETSISVLINSVLSLAFVFGVFHGQTRIPVLGAHGIVPDVAPQTFMVTLMSCLVPGLLTRQRMRSGALSWHAGISGTKIGGVVLWAVVAAVLLTLVTVALCWVLLPHLIPDGASFAALLVSKVIFGASLAAIATPWAIKRVLR